MFDIKRVAVKHEGTSLVKEIPVEECITDEDGTIIARGFESLVVKTAGVTVAVLGQTLIIL